MRRRRSPNAPTLEHVRWADRLLLGREPDSAQLFRDADKFDDVGGLVGSKLYSAERAARSEARWYAPFDSTIIDRFAVPDLRGEEGFLKDYTGVRTRIDRVAWIGHRSGDVEQPPYPTNFHGELPRWVGVLTAIEAWLVRGGGEFRAMEVGAAWAPWLSIAGVAARRRGASGLKLVAIEAWPGFCHTAATHLDDNRFAVDQFEIINRAIWPDEGWSRFPRIDDPQLQLGFGPAYAGRSEPEPQAGSVVVPCGPLTPTIEAAGPLDLLVCTIHRREADILENAKEALDRDVRAVVAATTSRDSDHRLWSLFTELGWRRIVEQPAELVQEADPRRFGLLRDGCQAWLNPMRD